MTEAPTTSTKLSYDEVVDSLTGYEEADIETRFGSSIAQLLVAHQTKASRALVYVLEKRRLIADDVNDPAGKAYKAAMEETIGGLLRHFGDDVDEVMPDEPVTPAGKEPSLPA